jgi:hypothetical protein
MNGSIAAPAVVGRNPSGEIGEALRRADRALGVVMELFAVEAQASVPKLHGGVQCTSLRAVFRRNSDGGQPG